ncbi:MAG: hypothetical protein SPI12_06230 [Actinomycetaceae bacterium]|nr:hypothetical protein [Actinomycetaceae bacterium]MDY6083434.1 hypothetical protein [Actinomycetaceae bacterium]
MSINTSPYNSYTSGSPNGWNANNDSWRATTSVVIGVASILAGWLFVAPLIGIWFGVKSKKLEPYARHRANWGIGLNLLAIFGWFIVVIVGLATGVLFSVIF